MHDRLGVLGVGDLVSATPAVLVITAADLRKVQISADRRRQGLPGQIRDRSTVDRVVRLIRTE